MAHAPAYLLVVYCGHLSKAGGPAGGLSFTDTSSWGDLEFHVPNNLDIDCVAGHYVQLLKPCLEGSVDRLMPCAYVIGKLLVRGVVRAVLTAATVFDLSAGIFSRKQSDTSHVYSSNLNVINIFDREDGTAIICQQFKVWNASNDFGQQRNTEARWGCLVVSENLGVHQHICHILCDESSTTRTIFRM